jgi:hypothetical protein
MSVDDIHASMFLSVAVYLYIWSVVTAFILGCNRKTRSISLICLQSGDNILRKDRNSQAEITYLI